MRVDARVLWAGLAASLLVNLFLAGVATGRWLAPVHRAATAAGFAPAAQVRLLPAGERARFEAAFAPHRPEIRAARQVTRDARAQVEADLAAPAYKRTKVEADLAALRRANLAQQAAAHAALAEAMAELPASSRATLISHARAETATPRVGNGASVR